MQLLENGNYQARNFPDDFIVNSFTIQINGQSMSAVLTRCRSDF
ncbi:MAG: hypothetical protein ACW98Y_16115 [Candidatus Thorarchaeota archaeon]